MYIIIYAHCVAEGINIFNVVEVIHSIEKLRKEKRNKG